MSKKKKNTLTILAVALLAAALVWSLLLNSRSEVSRLVRNLNAAYGYDLRAADIYPAENWEQRSIRSLLPETDLQAAVEASRAAGLPSDIDEEGHILLLLANTEQDIVVTLFLLDGQIELGFEQQRASDAVYPLGTHAGDKF